MEFRRVKKGQYSTFLKPFIILIFGGLLMALLVNSLNFNIGVAEDRSQIQFQSSPTEVFTKVSNCLSGNIYNPSSVFNQSYLEKLDRNTSIGQLNCAQFHRYGYSVTVSQEFIDPIEPKDEERDLIEIAFVLDDTASMGPTISGVKNNVRDFAENTGDSRAAIVTYKDSGDITVDQGFTTNTGDIESTLASINANGGNYPEEAVSGGLGKALNSLNWKSDSNKVIVLVNNEGAHNCGALENKALNAANREISVYTVFSEGDCSEQIENYIPQTTGGEHFKFEENWNKILGDIAGEIVTDKVKYRGRTTCTVPEIPEYDSSAEIVVTSDASTGYAGEWYTICNRINRTEEKLESRGLDTEISYYAPSQPGNPENGKGKPVGLTNGEYNYNSGTVPTCVDSSDNNAATGLSKGITQWDGEGLRDYNSSKDYGLEAWGISSKWILENHEWGDEAEKRILFVLGDQLPTGGNSSKETFSQDTSDKLEGETEIAENVTELAREKNVEVYTMANDFEYRGEDMYGDPEMNDALEIMKNVSSSSGGKHLGYESIGRIPGKMRRQLQSISKGALIGGTCKNVDYSFGQLNGSEGEDLENSLRSSFPSSIKHSSELTTPATTTVELKKGTIERLTGSVNKVINAGDRFNEKSSTYVDINNDKTIETREIQVKERKKTTYMLQNPGGDKKIDVKDDLVIGINGKPVFEDRDGTATEIDFSKPENQFKAYKGANIQIIGLNIGQPRQGLEKLQLTCTNGCNNQNQTVNPVEIDTQEGETEYLKRGERGVFYTNYTDVEIGKTEYRDTNALCYQNSKRCLEIKADQVESFKLRPGNHEVFITYSTSEGVSFG